MKSPISRLRETLVACPCDHRPAGHRRFYRLAARLLTVCLLLCVGGFPLEGQTAPSTVPGKFTPAALTRFKSQLAIAHADKAARTATQDKVSSSLLFAAREERTGVALKGVESFHAAVDKKADGLVQVDIKATVTPALLTAIKTAGGVVVNSFAKEGTIRARLPLLQLETLAARSDVQRIRPGIDPVPGSFPGEGVTTHRADYVQNNFYVLGSTSTKVTGAGIKVGVLSDSDDYASAAQQKGDLPSFFEIQGQSGSPATGEGSAMMEVVHEMAPGAQLYFATGDGGGTAFAQNIRTLQAQGCQIIIDDLQGSDENPFVTNPIDDAIRDVCAQGVLYFSCARNFGNFDDGTGSVWEGDFVSSSTAGTLDWGSGSNYNKITSLSSYGQPLYLYWVDSYGHTADDYDVYTVDDSGNLVAISNDRQNGTGDPQESIPFSKLHVGDNIIVELVSGAVRDLHLDLSASNLTYFTAGATGGHNAAQSANAFCVAATPAANYAANPPNPSGPYPNPFNSSDVTEIFSSDGPRRIFIDESGKEITPGNRTSTGGKVLLKPDLTAADGVTTSGVYPDKGLDTFFGTSCAAPHAGAIAALLLSYNPQLTGAQVRNALQDSAIDIMGTGWDRDSGYGIVMADAAIEAVGPQVTLSPTSYTFDVPLHNATAQQTFSLQIKNTGVSTLNYQLNSDTGFLDFQQNQLSGSVAPDGTTTITVYLDNSLANGEDGGTHEGDITVSDTGGTSSAKCHVTLNVEDSTAPEVAVSTPANGSVFQAFSTVSGTASDSGGIQANLVDFTLFNVNSNQYWSGTGWSDSAVILGAPFNASTGVWTWNGKLPNVADGTIRTGPYTLSAYATDNSGNVSQDSSGVNNITFTVDNTPPTLTITSPANNSTLVNLTSIAGTSIDDTKTGGGVNVFLHRQSDNSYWDGAEWVVFNGTYPILHTTYDPQNGPWSYTGSLPQPGNDSAHSLINGSYDVTAVAVDAAGNQTQQTNYFTEDFAFVWTGATLHDSNANNDSNSWNTPANWSPASVPGTGDKVVISNGDTVDLGGNQTVRALVLDGGSTLMSSVSNSTVTVTGAVGSILAQGTVTSITVSVPSGAALTMNTTASPFLNGMTLTNVGTVTFMASDATNPGVVNADASTISNLNGGVIQFANDGQPIQSYSTQSVIVNAGMVTKTAGTGLTNLAAIDFTNNATGVFGAATGTLEFTGGNITLNGGSKVAGTGAVLFATPMTISGALTVLSPVHFQSTMTFTVATLTQGAAGSLLWDTGQWTGTVSIPSGSAVSIDTTGTPFLNALTLNNTGTLVFRASDASNQGLVNADASAINNLSGGVIQILHDGVILQSYSTASSIFNKAGGVISKTTANAGRSEIGITLDNAGTVTAAAGTLAFSGGGATANGSTGAFNAAAASSRIEFAGNSGGSTFTLKSGATFTGPGLILMTGGEVTLAGAVKVGTTQAAAGGVKQTGGTIDGAGSLTLVAGDGPFAVAGGQFDSTLDLNTGATMTVDTSATPLFNNATVNNAGTITLTASDTSSVGTFYLDASTLNNQSGGVIQLGRDGTIFTSYSAQSTIVNSGTISKTGGTGLTDLGSIDFTNQASGVFGAAKGTLELTGGNITLNSGSTVGGAAIMQFSAPMTVNGTLNVKSDTHFAANSSVTFNAGLLVQGTGGVLHYDAGTWAGTFTVPLGTTLAVDTSGTPLVNNATFNNLGTVKLVASNASSVGTFYLDASTLNNQSGGVIQLTQPGSAFTSYSAQSIIKNSGTLVKTTGTTVTDVGSVDLTNLANGVLGANTGSLTVSQGTVTMSAGGKIAGPGKVLFTGDATFNGTTTATTEVHLQGGTKTFASSGALAQGTGGSLHLDSGNVAGSWNIPAGTTFVVDTSGTPILNNATLNNSGVLNLTPSQSGSAGTFYGASSIFNNLSGGVIQLNEDATAFTSYSTQSTLTNTGTITKTGGTGTSDLGPVTFLCHGTLNAPTKGTTLLVSNPVTFDGTGSTISGAGNVTVVNVTLNGPVNVATGGTLAFGSQGSSTLTGAVDANNKPLGSINGPGTFLLTGGTVTGTVNLGTTSATTLTNTNGLQLNNLTLNNAGTMTITGGTSAVQGTSTTFNNLQGASLVVQSNVYLQNTSAAPSFVNAGTIKLGTTKPVVATTDWSVSQTSTGLLQLYVAGTNASTPQFSQLKVLNNVTLDGTLEADLASGYTPANKGQFANVLAFASHTGDFAHFTYPNAPAGTKLTKLTSATGITLTAYDVPAINSALTATANDGDTFTYQITATNSPTSYNATNLPAGLTIDTTTGKITGTVQAGTYNIGLVATNTAGDGKATLVLTVNQVKPTVTSAATLVANVGTAVNYQITATHSPTSYAATGLPPGLSVNTTTGLITGKPTTQGAYTATVSVTNSAGTGSLQVKFTVNEAIPVVTSVKTASGNVGVTFNYQITATNSPTSYSASGNPPGVSTNHTTGLITGKPTKAGTYQATISATNSGGTSAAVVVTITIKAAPVITSALNETATQGKAFSYQIAATNTPTSYSASGNPSGVSTNTTTGVISGTPKVSGTFNIKLSATNADGTGTATLTLVVAAAPPSITSAKTATATVGTAFTYQIVATNTPTSYGATGLPAGLSVNTTTGAITGKPTTAATASVTLSATNGAGKGTATLTLTVKKTSGVNGTDTELARNGSGVNGTASTKAGDNVLTVSGPARIISAAVVDAQAGKPFSYQIAANREAATFAASELPAGLDLDAATGLISGTPAEVGEFQVDLTATTSGGEAAKGELTLKIGRNPIVIPAITSVLTASGEAAQALGYQIVASGDPVGYRADGLPDGVSIDPYSGLIEGTPTTAGEYQVTLGATNQGGTGTAELLLTVTPAPLPVVSVAANVAHVTAGTGESAAVTLSIPEALSSDLNVSYEIAGSAVNGVDYRLLRGTQTIRAGRTTATVRIVPHTTFDGTGGKSVRIVLVPGAEYEVGTPAPVEVEIVPGK